MGEYVVALGATDIDEYFLCETPLIVGGKCCIKNGEKHPGGFIANAACVLGMLGNKTYLLDTLGTDEDTELLMESFEEHCVDTTYIQILPDYKNLKTTIYLHEGERTIFIHENNKPPVKMTEDIETLIENASAIYTSVYHLKEIENFKAYIKRWKKAGVILMIDVEAPTFQHRNNREDKFVFEMADIICFNDASYQKYCEGSKEDYLRKLANRNGKIVMCTKGADGCLVYEKDRSYLIPAHCVTVRDTTGAGDTHNAAFLHAYLKTKDAEYSSEFAAAAAARAITRYGAQAGAVSEKEIISFWEGLKNK